MPLSEEELRLLEQMERALVAEDPKFASTLRGTALRRNARRRVVAAIAVFLVGIVILMTGAVTSTTYVGIIGFVVMLVSACVALVSWRGQAASGEEVHSVPDDISGGFGVIEGGKSKKRRTLRSRPARSQHGSIMERFEERWRRRRDQNGGY